MSYYDMIRRVPCVEPMKRKHGSTQPQWQSHRFPIKGGITWAEAMRRDLCEQRMIVGGKLRGLPVRVAG